MGSRSSTSLVELLTFNEMDLLMSENYLLLVKSRSSPGSNSLSSSSMNESD